MKKKNQSLTYTNKSEYEHKQIGYTQSQTSDWDGITSQHTKAFLASHGGMVKQQHCILVA